ncbi:LysR substrate-binding domain-containing protein [Chryseobacterium sp. JUb7]|uniref:LysR substrate-binding domain-containing protein n=1 Tax=Chryseobacterium sp. JUb7 TaxID=2940599 RepID=UPI002168A7F6|nr:LysR substrate-binding domain-containing protein [Chryseobacterium sp. JUb7]MCS3529290.1 LysR family cyn operon transcriptional activator [Chryseobacterium sp. JUb7]
MELRQLRYFLKAKELLNFTEAANHLYISQSTLSQQIKQLEEELGIPLFNRIGKRISLTEAGKIFSAYAEKSLLKSQEGFLALRDLEELKSGELNIGVTYGMRSTLIEALIRFSVEYPEVKVNIVFGTTSELIEKLHHLELDFALTFAEGNREEVFKYIPLFTSPMTLVVSKNAAIIRKESITLKEIINLPLALPTKGYSTTKFVTEAFKNSGLKPKVLIEINDIPTLLELIKSGKWYTILAQTTVTEKDELTTIPIKGKNMIRTAMLISLKDAYEKKAMKVFYQFLHR